MRRIFVLVTVFGTLAACETMPTGPVDSGGTTEPAECTTNSASMITVKYGDSSIDVTHRINVKKDEFFTLRLDPANSSADPVDYTTMDVYIFGSTTDAQWLNGTYNAGGANHKDFDICTTAPEGEYKYMVVIPGIGTIDPRVIVDPP